MAKKAAIELAVVIEATQPAPDFTINTNDASELKIEGAASPNPSTGEGVDNANQA